MMFTCASCPKGFKTGASLNFHTKKVHGENSLPSSKRDEQEGSSNGARRSERLRPVMLKFGKIPGMRDFTKGPFKVSRIALKIIEDRDGSAARSRRPSSRNSTAETELVDATEINTAEVKINPLIKRKPVPDVVGVNAAEQEKASPASKKTPTKQTNTDIEMPVLTPQSSPIRAPNVIASRGRPGPKRSKRGTHWKYNQQDDAVSTKRDDTQSPPRRKVVRRLDEAISSVSEPQTSQPTPASDVSTLETANSKTGKESVTNGVSTSPGSSTTSVSGENGKVTTTPPSPPPTISDNVQPRSTKPRPGKSSQQCQICGKTGFRNPNHFLNHLEVHEGKRPYLCPYPKCDMGYDTDIKLLEHVTIRHSQEAAFNCQDCGQEYRTQKGLNNHKCVKIGVARK